MGDFVFLYKISKDINSTLSEKVYFKRPQILDIYEDSGNEIKPQKNFQFFHKPRSYPLDLNIGFEDYKFHNDKFYQANVSIVENFLMTNQLEDIDGNSMRLCTTRSALYHIMVAPYNHRNWTIFATKYDGVLYLAYQIMKSENEETRNHTYHNKFAQYCFSESPEATPNIDIPIDSNVNKKGVFRSHLKDFDILYSADIGGVISNKEYKKLQDIEDLNNAFVFTRLMWLSQKANWYHHPKVLNWWLQSYLANCNNIYLGFKDEHGLVHSTKHVIVEHLPTKAKWKPDICIQFLYKFLNAVKTITSRVDCPHTTFEFRSDHANGCIKYRRHNDKTNYSFLSENFIEHIKNN